MLRNLPSARIARLNEQLFVQHGCQTGCQTRSNPFDNRFDNRLYRVYKHSTGCQTVFVKPVVQPD